jgi:excisionase family DNA binding protein
MHTSTNTLSDLIYRLKSGCESQYEREEWLSPKQLSNELGVNLNSVYRWIKSGELRAYDLSMGPMGKTYYRIRKSDVDKWLEDRINHTA